MFISLMVPVVLVIEKGIRRWEDTVLSASQTDLKMAIQQAESMKIIKAN